MPRRLFSSLIGVVAVLAILIGINLFAETKLASVQLDLTHTHQYTLSRGTRTVLRGLKEPVTLRLFYSRLLGSTLPAYGSYADRVREMLEQYARVSRGKIRLEFYDPQPFSDTEDRALGYGLQGVPVDQSGQQIYFGLAGTNMVDDERNVPFFQPERERFLEYDLTKLVYELSKPSRPVVGVMSSLPLNGDPRMMMMMRGQGAAGRPWASIDMLRQTFTVKDVKTDVWSIDPGIQVLLVAQAQHLPPQTLYAIDQFVMRGGRLMAMVDPDSEAESATPGPDGVPPADLSSDLAKLFDAWGIAFDPNQVVGDLDGAWRVRANATDRVQVVDYVAWFNIRAPGIDRGDPATADLTQVTVASPGALSLKPGTTGITFTPLLTTTAQSALIPATQTRANPDPAKILAAFKPDGKDRVIAARVRGVLKSAFTGPPDAAPGQQRPADLPPFKADTGTPANLVVVGDSDILADRYWVRTQDFFGQSEATPFSDNGAFVSNLVGTLAGGDALIGLRSRGDVVHPFTVIDNMQHQAEARFRRTEQTLTAHLQETQKQLQDLRGGGANGAAAATVTTEQQDAIEKASHEIVDTRRQLRAVQLDLKQDIDRLETETQIADIVLVPALLAVAAIGIALVRRRRRAASRA